MYRCDTDEDAAEVSSLRAELRRRPTIVDLQTRAVRRVAALRDVQRDERRAALAAVFRRRQLVPVRARRAWRALTPDERRAAGKRVSLADLGVAATPALERALGGAGARPGGGGAVARGRAAAPRCRSLLPADAATTADARGTPCE
eukprot:gene17550-46058_t